MYARKERGEDYCNQEAAHKTKEGAQVRLMMWDKHPQDPAAALEEVLKRVNAEAGDASSWAWKSIIGQVSAFTCRFLLLVFCITFGRARILFVCLQQRREVFWLRKSCASRCDCLFPLPILNLPQQLRMCVIGKCSVQGERVMFFRLNVRGHRWCDGNSWPG